MSTIFWFLVGETVVMALLTVYLQAVLPSEFGVRRSPLFFLEPIFKLFRGKGADATTPPVGDELPVPAGGAVIDMPDALRCARGAALGLLL